MKKWFIIFAVLAGLGALMEYPVIGGIILGVAFVAYLLFIIIKERKEQKEFEAKRKAEAEKEAARKAAEEARKTAEEARLQAEAERQAARELERKQKEEAAERERAKKVQLFNAELDAIPQISIDVSAPASRQYLKDMPDFDYSNITKTTKLSSIFPLVVLDVETTGLYPAKSEIVEIAAIKFDAGMNPTASFATLCKPKRPTPPEISRINGITDEMVEDKPNFHEIAPALSQFLQGCNLAGHNLVFDMEFLYVHGTELPFDKKFYDTLELAQRTIKKSDIWNHKLNTLCDWYGICRDDAHRALSDCYATSKIFTRLVFDKTSRMLDDGSNIIPNSDV